MDRMCRLPEGRSRPLALALAVVTTVLFLLLAGGAQAAVVQVTTVADDITPNDGSVSLREAIQAINAGSNLGDPDIIAQNPGTFGVNDTIDFAIPQPPGGPVRQTIVVENTGSGALPVLIKPMTINGYSESGASMNTLANGDNAVVEIALDGAGAGPGASGLLVGATGAGSTVEGLDIFDFSHNQVELQGAGNVVAGNDVGFDTTGSPAQSSQGVQVSNSSSNTIGGTTPAARNVISGNVGSGVDIVGTLGAPATGNLVQGNFIGTDVTGKSANGNGRFGAFAQVGAVQVSGGNANTIGGASAAARNVISGNGAGVDIRNGGEHNTVQGNFIGVGSDGVTPVPNLGFGVHMGSDDNLAPPAGPGQPNEPAVSGNIIGLSPTTLAGLGNLIEFNGGDGVQVDGDGQNNAVQKENSGNSILANSIHANGALGIDLHTFVGFPNPNNLMGAPTITAVTPGGSTVVKGTISLPGRPAMALRIELFSSAACDASGSGEGQTLIGFANTTTDGAGNASFSANVATVTPGQSVTATATNTTADPSTPAGSVNLYSTSQFSRCFTLTLPPQQQPLPNHSITAKVGNQLITLTTPSQSSCTASTGKLAVTLNSTAIPKSKGAKLKFTSAAFYIDKGVKHAHRKTLHPRKGRKKTVIVIVYTANATTHRVPAVLQLSLAGLKPGVHTLKVTVSYKQTKSKHAHKRTVTVTKTLTTKFSVC